jgi:hypothetical protein
MGKMRWILSDFSHSPIIVVMKVLPNMIWVLGYEFAMGIVTPTQ